MTESQYPLVKRLMPHRQETGAPRATSPPRAQPAALKLLTSLWISCRTSTSAAQTVTVKHLQIILPNFKKQFQITSTAESHFWPCPSLPFPSLIHCTCNFPDFARLSPIFLKLMLAQAIPLIKSI